MTERLNFKSAGAVRKNKPARDPTSIAVGKTVFEYDDASWLGTVVELSDDGEVARVNWGDDHLQSWVDCRDLRTGFESPKWLCTP